MLTNAKRALSDNDLDISINTNYASLIEMAKNSSQTDEEVIEKARESIRTGELESKTSIQKAAENILAFGI
ncbi:MAG: hypothetical protein JW787_14675 [Sedimentisphaerales bacterium]|nr:hypothetical protein [Sedimentisphaerales bacterium]